MNNNNNRFSKSQRLCSHHLIDQLFEPGGSKSLSAYPIRAVYRVHAVDKAQLQGDSNALLISVPKRYFKHAVDRNHVKRQIREAYRTNRNLLALPEESVVNIAMIWLDNKHHASSVVTAKVQNLLRRISEQINAEE